MFADREGKVLKDKSTEEKYLESILFGHKYEELKEEIPVPKTDELFFVDTSKRSDISQETLNALRSDDEEDDKPAWFDEDDEELMIESDVQLKKPKYLHTDHSVKIISKSEYEKQQKEELSKIFLTPEWAKSKKHRLLDSADKISSLNPFAILPHESDTGRSSILPDVIGIIKMRNANYAKPTKGPVESARFHPNGNVLLTSGKDGFLNLFQVDGRKNEKLQSIQFEGFPILQSEFISNGKEIINIGKQRDFYTFNLEQLKIEHFPQIIGTSVKSLTKIFPSPKNTYIAAVSYSLSGECLLLSGKTKQYLATFKINSTLHAVEFSPCESFLYLTGGERIIFIFDIRTRSCINAITDNGGLKCTALAISSDGSRLACGSDSGIVNVYECKENDPSDLTIVKSVQNLTSWIKEIRFNPTCELMGIAGNEKEDHFRILHLATNRVYSNWPTHSASLGRIQSFDWGNRNGLLTFGNHKGEALLFKLDHYTE